MKIYSWNMLYRNAELDRAFAFIRESDFDIFCLQEVPENFLERLQTLDCNIAYRTDAERVSADGSVRIFTVILTKYPIAGQGEISYDEYWPDYPLRARIFTRLMKPFHFAKIVNRHAVFADIVLPNMPSPVRVFCIHLSLTHPVRRLSEFEEVMTYCDDTRPMIVCGDFNILEAPHITILNWIFGGRLSDFFLYRRERANIERVFAKYKLKNALRGKITHPLSRSQLDHILVSDAFSAAKAEVIPDRIGSDHHPIFAEIVFPQLDHI
ncbi:MAG: endonuclease/exonuclease/phosphatase family protein [Minisyncoccia bacterium]